MDSDDIARLGQTTVHMLHELRRLKARRLRRDISSIGSLRDFRVVRRGVDAGRKVCGNNAPEKRLAALAALNTSFASVPKGFHRPLFSQRAGQVAL